MDLNKLTRRSQEALAAAQRLASDRNHQVIEPEHLLSALLSQSDGVVFGVVQRLGAVPGTLRERVDELLVKIVKRPAYSAADETMLISGFNDRLGADVKIRILYVDEIPRTANAKFKWVISNIRPNFESNRDQGQSV